MSESKVPFGHNWISTDGSTPYPAEKGRYHLYVAIGCPFAHRALIARKLKKLDDIVSVSVVFYRLRQPAGWNFVASESEDPEGLCKPNEYGWTHLSQAYFKTDPTYSGRFTVPTLWDRKTETVVSTESADIVRMFSTVFNEFIEDAEARALNLYPADLAPAVDEVLAWLKPDFIFGLYGGMKPADQAAYDATYTKVFNALDRAEELLSTRKYLTGDKLTEADVFFFAPLFRFDITYFTLCKLNKKLVADYPNLWAYLRSIYQLPGISETVNLWHIKALYFLSDTNNVVPRGPELDYNAPHGRETVGK